MNHQVRLSLISLALKENFVPKVLPVRTKMTSVFQAALLVLFLTKEENRELKIVKNVLKVNSVMQASKKLKHVPTVTIPIVSESDRSPIVSYVPLVTNVTPHLDLFLLQYLVELVFIQLKVQSTVMHVERVITVILIQLALKPCCTSKSVQKEHFAPMILPMTSTMTSYPIWSVIHVLWVNGV